MHVAVLALQTLLTPADSPCPVARAFALLRAIGVLECGDHTRWQCQHSRHDQDFQERQWSQEEQADLAHIPQQEYLLRAPTLTPRVRANSSSEASSRESAIQDHAHSQ